jgi:hypothetical protein
VSESECGPTPNRLRAVELLAGSVESGDGACESKAESDQDNRRTSDRDNLWSVLSLTGPLSAAGLSLLRRTW